MLRSLVALSLVVSAGCAGPTALVSEPPSAAASDPLPEGSSVVLASAVSVGVVVDSPAPVEDPVQFDAPRAPVRMELAQARRRVVLLPGVGARDAEAAPPPAVTSDAPGRVVYSRAVVVAGADGRREVRYLDARTVALDLGGVVGCDGAPLGSATLRLRGLRGSALRRGMRGDAVRVGQHLLCAAGHAVEATGVYDGATDRAVRAFQRAHNAAGRGRPLSVDGALGAKTRAALEAAVAAR